MTEAVGGEAEVAARQAAAAGTGTDEEQKAALKIQAMQRGKQARAKVAALKAKQAAPRLRSLRWRMTAGGGDEAPGHAAAKVVAEPGRR